MTDVIHGLVTGVYAEDLGDQLTAGQAIGDTVLEVNDICDFDEDGGFLLLNGNVLQYLTCDDDTSTITLAAPLTAVAAADDRVDVWDDTNSQKATVYNAVVNSVDGMVTTPIEATVTDQLAHALQTVMTAGKGVGVVMRRDGSEYQVDHIVGRAFTLASLQYLQGGMTTRQEEDDPGVDILGVESGTPGFYLYDADGNVALQITDDTAGGTIKFLAGSAVTPGHINPSIDGGGAFHVLDVKTSVGVSPNNQAAQFKLIGSTSISGPVLELVNGTELDTLDVQANGDVTVTGNVEADGHLATPNAPTTTSAANARIGGAGIVQIVTSLTEHKLKPEALTVDDVRPLLEVDPQSWFDRTEHEANGKRYKGLRRVPGALAEDVAEHLPLLADYDHQGNLQGVHNDRVGWLLIPIIRDQRDQLATLQKQISELQEERGR